MNLSELRGEHRVLRQLQHALDNNRLPHGLLFAGPEGVGKRAAAYALAARLLCEDPQGLDACGHCPSCRYLTAGTHPDLLLPAKDIPREGSIGIKRLRTMLGQLATTSHDKRSVVVLVGAERLTREAANAFLKTLEEPAPGITFILTASHPEALPETVRSRLATYLFAPLPAADVADLLTAADLPYRPAQIDLAARLSGGSLAKARRLLEDESLLTDRQQVFRLLDDLPRRHPGLLVNDLQTLCQVPGEKRLDRTALKARLRRFFGYAESYYLEGMKALLGLPATGTTPAPALPSAAVATAILALLRQGTARLETGADPALVFLVTLLAIQQRLTTTI